MASAGLFITGTDTGVGKTHVACLLARGLVAAGLSVAVMKPCETGLALEREGCEHRDELPPGSDAALLRAASGCAAAPANILPYAFALAAAPSVAAEAAGVEIERGRLDRARAELQAGHDLLLVEGAGGIAVPLSGGFSFLDLAAHWQLPVLIVARTGLGTLNHSVLTEQAAAAAGLSVVGLVLNAVGAPTSQAERANLGPLAELLSVPILCQVGHGQGPDRAAQATLVDGVRRFLHV